jgi:superfamily II DNA helicase RecQ
MQLEQLQRYDLATIEWGSTHPQVTFLLPRPPSKELTLKPEIYKERKQLAMNRLNKMMDFLATDCCRMHVIQDYFNQTKKNCGLCDRCLSKRTELGFYESEIGKLLETPKTFNELLTQLTIDAEILQSILRKWLLEEKIATENGRFRIRK